MTSAVQLDVLIIGAGLSGIGAAYRIQTEHPERSYAILEARSDLGGTWDLFRFPGVRSDSDMFTLGYPFHPWTDERSIADGASILAYIRDTARTFGIDDKIVYDHRVVSAAWSSEEARWTVEVMHGDEQVTYSCAFLFLCTGYYRYDAGYEVAFPGSKDFGGQIVHPQHWPAELDTSGKNVVVVGSGATAVTLVPALASGGAHVTWLQRSPSYLVSVRTRSKTVARLRRWLPPRLASRVARARSVLLGSVAYAGMRRWPRKGAAFLTEGVGRQLPDDVPVDPHFVPRYDPWDQRLCVITDGDLFTSIRNRTAEVITDEIATLTTDGLRLRSGRELDVDVLVTATGLSVVAFGQIIVSVDGREVDAAESLVYKGMMFDGVPNLAWAVGYPNASWTLRSDLTARYVCRLLRHLDRTGTTTVTPVRPGGLEPRPLFGFTSGYIQRAAGVMPQQGDRAPWRVWTSYPVDLLALRLGRVSDKGVRFSRAGRTAAGTSGWRSDVQQFVFAGKVAVVTGAAGGIGAALALDLARRGTSLALVDRDAEGLARVAEEAARSGSAAVTTYVVDLSDGGDRAELAVAVLADHESVDLLINNAGVALGGTFEEVSAADFDWLLSINLHAVIALTRAFLPALRARPGSHLVNVSSLFGLIAPPQQVAYATSKYAVRGFTEALRNELAGSVGVTVVHPGGIRTGIATNARMASTDEASNSKGRERMNALLTMPPEQAAAEIVDAVRRRRPRVVISRPAKLMDVLARVTPAHYWSVITRISAASRQARPHGH